MTITTNTSLCHWSTSEVEPAMRFEYYANALSTALTPMRLIAGDPRTFESHMTAASVGPVSVIRQSGSSHSVRRDPFHADRALEHSWHLIVNLSSAWNTRHRELVRLLPGEMMIVDSRLDFMVEIAGRYDVAHFKFSPAWLRQWIPAPEALVGRRIASTSGWGRALGVYLTELSPEVIEAAPLPVSVLTDHIGALLALIAAERDLPAAVAQRRDDSLLRRIRDCIAQRSAEQGVCAADIARELNISVRSLHRTLAAHNETFGKLLIDRRAAVAVRMIRSSVGRRLSLAEIGRRAGFADPSHFSRVISGRYGMTPSRIRNEDQRSPDDAENSGS
ncbi:AraC family transcriptional regulator [Paraburkholderia sp. J11-2]|uniref:AraC family transcriptional regulator n=1 Tax=Paraburkholderia sp. J11-2 TaxID=2805431 RepID=UPI002AB633D6|nr:AraC family transcriptional regulator [Paraburkholderia sp. J11-2]